MGSKPSAFPEDRECHSLQIICQQSEIFFQKCSRTSILYGPALQACGCGQRERRGWKGAEGPGEAQGTPRKWAGRARSLGTGWNRQSPAAQLGLESGWAPGVSASERSLSEGDSGYFWGRSGLPWRHCRKGKKEMRQEILGTSKSKKKQDMPVLLLHFPPNIPPPSIQEMPGRQLSDQQSCPLNKQKQLKLDHIHTKLPRNIRKCG